MLSLIPLLVGFQLPAVQVVSVAGGSGAAKRLQAAVDGCPAEGCVIQLPDAEYAMENMVWIRKRSDIRIAGTGAQPPHLIWDDTLLVADTTGTAHLFDLVPYPDSSRQTPPKGWLRWPDTLQPNIPGSVSDTTNEFSQTGFQHGGMFVVDQSKRIRFQRLFLDGRKTAAFEGSGINWLLLHGSVGISLFQSLAVDVAECEIARFWAAVYSTEWNAKCSSWQDYGSSGTATSWTACGKMGGHLVERNRLHDNWYGFYSNSALDQGSVLRENLAWNNRNQYLIDPSKSVTPRSMIGTKATLSTTLQDIPGGFLMVSNVLYPVHVATHNTLLDDAIPYLVDGSGRAIPTALWSDNIFDLLDSVGSTRISGTSWVPNTTRGVAHFWNNLVRHRSPGYRQIVSSFTLSDTTLEDVWWQLTPRDTVPGNVPGSWLRLVPRDTVDGTVHYDTFTVRCDSTLWRTETKNVYADPMISLLQSWNLFYSPTNSPYGLFVVPGIRQRVDVKTGMGTKANVSQWFPGSIDSTSFAGIATADTATALRRGNRICRDCPFLSVDPSSPDFLVPDARSWQVDSALSRKGSYGKDIGAFDTRGGTGSRPPLRVRAIGVPTYDKTSKQLLLPVRLGSENVKLDKIFAWRASITSGSFDPSNPRTVSGLLKETALALTAPIPDLSVTDSVIRIPLAPGSTDTLIQVDLWLGGISGTDTVAGTPMSWVWFSKAKGSTYQTASASRSGASAPRWSLAGRTLRIFGRDDLAAGSRLLLTDARGRAIEVDLQRVSNRWEADLSRLSRGVWIARLPGSAAWVLQHL